MKTIITIALYLLTLTLFGQVENKEPIEEELIFTICEEMPLFNGAKNWKQSNKLTEQYFKEKVELSKYDSSGAVYIKFILNEKGAIENKQTLKGVNPKIDSLAIQMINEMPKWKAGKQRNIPVKVEKSVVIRFK